MKSLMLAVNIGERDFSVSNITGILMSAFERECINDLILFLPALGNKTEEFLFGLAQCCEMGGHSLSTNIFIEEEDKSSLPFEFLTMLRERFPRFSIYSKEDEVCIGEHSFKYFTLDNYCSDDLDKFLEEIYSKEKTNVKECFAVSSDKDARFLRNISRDYLLLTTGDPKVLARHRARDAFNVKLVKKHNIEYVEGKNSYYYSSDEKLQKACFLSATQIENAPVLKKVPSSTKKKVNK